MNFVWKGSVCPRYPYPEPLDDLIISFSSTSWDRSIKEDLSGLNFSAAIGKFAQGGNLKGMSKIATKPITKTGKLTNE